MCQSDEPRWLNCIETEEIRKYFTGNDSIGSGYVMLILVIKL